MRRFRPEICCGSASGVMWRMERRAAKFKERGGETYVAEGIGR
jgi:hypothetical protein